VLRQRRDDHRELLPQPGELLTQLRNRSSVIGHCAIININPPRSSRRAAGGPDQLLTDSLPSSQPPT
jgi:hypothetical protein